MLKYCLHSADNFDKILNVGRLITTEPARVVLFDNKIGFKTKVINNITVLKPILRQYRLRIPL